MICTGLIWFSSVESILEMVGEFSPPRCRIIVKFIIAAVNQTIKVSADCFHIRSLLGFKNLFLWIVIVLCVLFRSYLLISHK